MTAGLLLLTLLGLAYAGALLTGSRRSLPSHVEFAVLGVVLGSSTLGIIRPTMLEAFDPLARLAMGWVALGTGFALGPPLLTGARRLGVGLGLVRTVVTGGLVGAAAHAAITWTAMFPPTQAVAIAVGLGALACQRARIAPELVRPRGHLAPREALLDDVVSSSHAAAFMALAWLFAVVGPDRGVLPASPLLLVLTAPLLGAMLGVVAGAVLRTGLDGPAQWGVLIGTAAVGTGISLRVGVLELATMLFMGMTLRALVTDDGRVQGIFAVSLRTVLLPLLLLVGARVDVRLDPQMLLVVGTSVVVTIAATLAANLLAFAPVAEMRRLGPRILLVYLSPGPLVLCAGFACLLRMPEGAGPLLLAFALCTAMTSEVLGLASARWVLGPRSLGPAEDPP